MLPSACCRRSGPAAWTSLFKGRQSRPGMRRAGFACRRPRRDRPHGNPEPESGRAMTAHSHLWASAGAWAAMFRARVASMTFLPAGNAQLLGGRNCLCRPASKAVQRCTGAGAGRLLRRNPGHDRGREYLARGLRCKRGLRRRNRPARIRGTSEISATRGNIVSPLFFGPELLPGRPL